jgi:Tol biopolymer transport system component/imidazolonepropionase-like amidohydrolase
MANLFSPFTSKGTPRMNRGPLTFASILLYVACMLGTLQTSLAGGDSTSWNVSAPHGPGKTIEFETDEGTWMAVDVSPDGRTVVFDLAGNIYVMPIAGGRATRLTEGPGLNVQPRFSPDGKRIAFTSDRGGIDNLWIMDVDGRNPHQISLEAERQVNNPIWTPDGRYLIGRKHYRNTRSLGAGEMWMYHTGGGTGLQVTKRRNWQQDAGEPAISPDGRYLFYSEDVSPGGVFEYNKDPNGVIYAIQRHDLETGRSEQFVSGPGGSFRPQVSPDGKTVAFVRRVRLHTVLFLCDMESGRETPVYDQLDHDQQEVWAIFGVYPGFSWTPDSRSIVIWAQGKIHRIDVRTHTATEIPFTANVKQYITDAVRFPREVAPENFDVKMLQWVTVAPDGRSVVYSALGKLWIRPLPDGTPKRLTGDDERVEMYPSFSPDAQWIVFATWNDDEMGTISKVRTDGSRRSVLTRKKGTYVEPSYAPDGNSIVYRRIGGDDLRGDLYSRETGIYRMPSAGGAASLITEEGARPLFNAAGDRIFLFSDENGKPALVSVGLKGEDRRVHILSDAATQIIPSPDEEWISIVERYNAYVAVFPKTGQAFTIGPKADAYPIHRVSRDAGSFLHWSPDSKRLYWSLGPDLYTCDLMETFGFLRGAQEKTPPLPDTSGIFIGFQAKTDNPTGTVALVGATVITMKGDEVIPDATILVEGNRISDIGPSAGAIIPRTATRIDLAGAFVIPGMIDVHAHGNSEIFSPRTNWKYYANLAYGVTTMHDPSARTDYVFSNSEMLKAGIMVGPRLYSTGTILYGAEGIQKAEVRTLDDAMSHLRRLQAVGAFSVKSYNQPRRDARQQIIEAARSLHMMVFPEGGSTFFWNFTMVLDGHTGVEHNIPVAPLYNDIIRIIAASRTGLTPTLVVNFAGLWGENYWYQHTNVWENERLLRFVPRTIIDPRSRRRIMAPEGDFHHIETARTLKRILDAGGSVQLGAHGQLQGLGAHWELWMLQQGGMTPLEALRCATLNGAWYLGLDKDLGSLESGKLADLVVLDRNPLEDIRNSESVRMVMVNGRLFDAGTMNEIGNHPRPREKFYWER